MDVLRDHEILLGTYEAFVLGYKTIKAEAEEETDLQVTFSDRGHSACVRCVAAAGKFLLSGAGDENVKVIFFSRILG